MCARGAVLFARALFELWARFQISFGALGAVILSRDSCLKLNSNNIKGTVSQIVDTTVLLTMRSLIIAGHLPPTTHYLLLLFTIY